MNFSDYARPHPGLSPGAVRPPGLSLPPGVGGGPPPPSLDPLLHYTSMASMYPPGARERLELEARERELISERIKEELMKRPIEAQPNHLSPWLSTARYPGVPATLAASLSHTHSLYHPSSSAILAAERDRIERFGKIIDFLLLLRLK